MINERKTLGSKFIENLAADIRISFPNVKGYSVRNLKHMAKFAETYPDEAFVQTVSAQIPWSHNTIILDKVKDADQRVWYIQKTTENGCSHNVLIHQIESGLHELQVLAGKIANFENRLASPQSELALQTMKDPYIFDFIPFSEDMVERDIENALVKDITKDVLIETVTCDENGKAVFVTDLPVKVLCGYGVHSFGQHKYGNIGNLFLNIETHFNFSSFLKTQT